MDDKLLKNEKEERIDFLQQQAQKIIHKFMNNEITAYEVNEKLNQIGISNLFIFKNNKWGNENEKWINKKWIT